MFGGIIKDFIYRLYIDSPSGRETILEGEKDPHKVRRVATSKSMSRRLRRGFCKAIITRDNKELPGGRYALDGICLDKWLEENKKIFGDKKP